MEWKKAKAMRDILAHPYPSVNAEVVFYTCKEKIPLLHSTIQKIIKDLKSSLRIDRSNIETLALHYHGNLTAQLGCYEI